MFGLTKVPLFEDELLTSFMSRISRANGRTRSSEFCRDVGINRIRFEKGDSEEILRFAELVELPLAKLMLHAVEVRANNGAVIGGEYFPAPSLARRKLRFCPACLVEDEADQRRIPGTRKYCRKEWMVPTIRTCRKHEQTLVQSLDVSYVNHSYDFLTALEIEKDNMPEIVARSVAQKVTPFEIFVSDRVSGRRNHGPLLNGLTLASCIYLCELTGAAALHGKRCRVTRLGDAALLEAANHAFEKLEKGEEGLHALLDAVRKDAALANQRGGQAIYGQMYNSLYAEGPEFDTIRKAIRNYTLASMPIINGSDLFGKVDDSPWTTVNTVVRATGIGDSTARRILFAMGHIPTHHPNQGDRFLSSAGAEEAIAMLNGSMPSIEAAKIIGCTEHVFLRWVAEGFFTPLQFDRRAMEDRNYVMLDRFARSEIEGFRLKLDNAITAMPAPGMISLAAAASLIGAHQKQILELVLEGRLRTVAMKATSGPFSSRLLVVDSEVYSELGLPVGLSAAETALRLGIQRGPLAALVARGVLNPVSFGLKRRQVYDEREVGEFRSAYISFGAACTEFGLNRMELMYRLQRLNITPAFPKDEIGVFLFTRSDIPRLLAAAA